MLKAFQLFLILQDFVKNTKFDHRAFNPEWRCEPKPCKGNPTWNLGNEMWLGKEAAQDV